MNRDARKIAEERSSDVCVRPSAAGLLYDYVTDLLDDPAAGEFEDHLLDCRCCRQEYLTLLSLRDAGAAAMRQDGGRASRDAKVVSLAAFRKGTA